MEYRYGTYGEFAESIVQSGSVSETVPVYIGTAPIGLVRGFADKELVNTPIQIQSLGDAKNKIGHCEDTESFSLCEAVAAHFDNGNETVGPIYVINVLDPEKHKGEETQRTTLSFVRNKTELSGTHTILDSIKLLRPLTDYPDMAYCYAQEDAQAVFEAKGKKNAPVSAGQVFYIIMPKALDKTTDYLMTVEADGKVYGVRGKADGRPDNTTVIYFSILSGSQTDFVDGAKKDGNEQGKLDLSTFTGDVEFSLYTANYNGDYDTYPTETELVQQTTLHFDNGACPQYYEENRDYALTYNHTRGAAVIEDITESMPATVEVTYDTVDDDQVTVDDIVGAKTANGEYTGIAAVDLVFTKLGKVPNILAAPGWSHNPEVYKALCKAGYKANGHWYAMVFADMPLVDSEMRSIDTMALAIEWKNKNHYDNEFSKVFWPMVIDSNDRLCHASTLAVVEQLRVDQTHDAVPFETCGNKSVNVQRQYFGEDSRNRGFDQTDANTLTAEGIATVAPWGTEWVIWGDHTAAFRFESNDADLRCIFDVTVRMLMHILNSFQLEWARYIDSPMTRQMKDRIVNREQEKLDNLVAQGALLGNPTVKFSTETTVQDILYGNFVWDFIATPTVPLKSAKAIIAFSDAGYDTLLEGSEQ